MDNYDRRVDLDEIDLVGAVDRYGRVGFFPGQPRKTQAKRAVFASYC